MGSKMRDVTILHERSVGLGKKGAIREMHTQMYEANARFDAIRIDTCEKKTLSDVTWAVQVILRKVWSQAGNQTNWTQDIGDMRRMNRYGNGADTNPIPKIRHHHHG